MDRENLKRLWMEEERAAHIRGWDFSHIRGRYEEEADLPWNYGALVRTHLKNTMDILDYDTGGGEFLLSLHHPYEKTAATEGFNVEKETLNVSKKLMSILAYWIRLMFLPLIKKLYCVCKRQICALRVQVLQVYGK